MVVAAESIPGVLPAVKFDVVVDGCRYCEDHVDGGPATQIFLRPGPSSMKTQNAGWLKGSNFYAMAGGKMYAPELTGNLGIGSGVHCDFQDGSIFGVKSKDRFWEKEKQTCCHRQQKSHQS